MSRKHILTELGKIILAGAIALMILTLFCMLYYNVPIRYACEDGVTDCKRKSDVFYSRGTEGFAYGKTNNEGYTNMFDYEEGDSIDILLMGSSNMEACQVAMEESTASRLNAMLKGYTVYNIGMDSHDFIVCASNLQAAVSKYQPSKYVIIETAAIHFRDEDLINAINGAVPEIPSYSGGIIGFLQNNQYLRLLNAQRGKFLEGKKNIINLGIFTQADDTKAERFIKVETMEKAGTVIFTEVGKTVKVDKEMIIERNKTESIKEEKDADINETQGNEELISVLLKKMSNIVQANGAKIIIAYHPHTEINEDGSLSLISDTQSIEQFMDKCENNGILFLDMSERFLKEYTDKYILPYGFANTSIGIGHMNKYGHAMMADELSKLIERDS